MPRAHDDNQGLAQSPMVLVVDNESAVRTEVSRMIRGFGYPVRSARGGQEALDVLLEHPREVRLLIAELGMPRMDGGELAERARDLDPGLMVLLMVEPGDPQVAELAAGYRDLPSLEKPVTFGDLYRTIQELIGPPAGPPAERRSRMRPRRRSSGHHRV